MESIALAKDLSPLFPKITMILPEVTTPANSSVLPAEVSSLSALTVGFLVAANAEGETRSAEIIKKEKRRFTLIPASDRAQLSLL